jgi:hypothetical protein
MSPKSAKIRAAAPARSASIHDRCKAVFEGLAV